MPTKQSLFVVAFSVKSDGLNGVASPLRWRAFPCKCLNLVYLPVRGAVAERLKAAVC
jgi:hypothetical protein